MKHFHFKYAFTGLFSLWNVKKKTNIDDLQNGEKKKDEREGHGKGETEREVERERVRRKRKRIPVCSPPGGASGNMNERTERVCH